MKKWLAISLVMGLLFNPLFLVADDFVDSMPKLENFKVLLIGPRMARLDFNFGGVKGGLPGAEFTIIYEVERNGVVIQSGQALGLKFSPDPRAAIKISTSQTGENGEVKTTLPVEETIRIGDKIRYLIYLTDAQGRKSNAVEFTFIFAEVQII